MAQGDRYIKKILKIIPRRKFINKKEDKVVREINICGSLNKNPFKTRTFVNSDKLISKTKENGKFGLSEQQVMYVFVNKYYYTDSVNQAFSFVLYLYNRPMNSCDKVNNSNNCVVNITISVTSEYSGKIVRGNLSFISRTPSWCDRFMSGLGTHPSVI